MVSTTWTRLERTPLPAVVPGPDGSFLVLAKAGRDKVLVYDAVSGQTWILDRDAFAPLWDGRLLCLGRKGAPGMGVPRFDIGWFGAAVWKYRGILGEVLTASLFLQLFALVTLLFFQVISALIRSCSSVVGPGRLPWSRSACRTQSRSVSGLQPIFAAIELIAAHCEACSPA